VTAFVTVAAGFLLAVLWFDLMFDVQVARYRGSPNELPEETLASIAGYYRRVTTDARPMNLLVGTAMVGLLVAVVAQIAQGEAPDWAAWTSLALAGAASSVAVGHTFGRARRLGGRADTLEVQTRLARSILRDHVFCLVAITALLVIQLGFAT
jgi:hypothetical protein